MKPFHSVTSSVIPLPIKDIDTDMIFPAKYLTSTGSSGYRDCLFAMQRSEDSSFVLNDERYSSSHILLAKANFGCGSSREHAVWALLEWGVQVVIAPSFADIFKNNAGKNGLLLVELDEAIIEQLFENIEKPSYELTINLEIQTVVDTHDVSWGFQINAFRKVCILDGLDDLTYITSHTAAIETYQSNQAQSLWYQTTKPNNPLAPNASIKNTT